MNFSNRRPIEVFGYETPKLVKIHWEQYVINVTLTQTLKMGTATSSAACVGFSSMKNPLIRKFKKPGNVIEHGKRIGLNFRSDGVVYTDHICQIFGNKD